ncbi:MAG: Mur ligase family protein [Chitinophagales bacterium]
MKDHFKEELIAHQIAFEEQLHTEERILNADIVVKSPGIPEKVAIIKKIRDKKIAIVSEIEWAAKFIDGTIVAITGSNGKTTTTSLTHHILEKAGLDVAVAGNIGKSLARTVSEKNFDYYVVEVSSFQLDDIETFKPHISVIMNITEDHLDRYNYNFDEYIASKMAITKNQDKNDYCIYCLDDAVTKQNIQAVKNTTCIPFSWEESVSEGAFIQDDQFIFQLKKTIYHAI